MRIADNVEMLSIHAENGVNHPVLTWDDNELVLIDTGLPMQTEALREAVAAAGFALTRITKVIITHQDLDHIGSAKALSGMGAEILAHTIEAPYIQGDVTSIRLAQMEARLSEASEDERAFYERAKKGAPYFYVHVDRLLEDGETLNFCGGVEVIHTPGHMPGHIALLLKKSRIIVAGDAANILEGELTGADPKFTEDMETAAESLLKMKAKHPAGMVCYHGGYIEMPAEHPDHRLTYTL